MLFSCHNKTAPEIFFREVIVMNYSLKNQVLANSLFIAVFSALFIVYCAVTSSLLSDTDEAQSASVDAERRKVILLDPGHGGEDGGAVGVSGVLEKDLNLMISTTLYDLFRFSGYDVRATRDEDVMLYDRNADYKGKKKILDLAARLEIANSTMPDLFVGIHMNSFPQEKYSGLTVYYSPNKPQSLDAAEALRSDVIRCLQPDNKRELKAAGSNIYILNRIEYPAILIECGFLSNSAECNMLSDAEYRQRLSFVIFSSLSAFLEE